MSSLGIARAVRDLIDDSVNARTTLVEDAKKGDTALAIQLHTPFISGERIALRDSSKTELHQIACIEDQLGLCSAVDGSYKAGEAFIQKVYGGQFVQDVFVGTPEQIDNSPSISIEVRSMIREPFTLESVSDFYSIDISIWNDATTFTGAYENLLRLTDATQQALFRELYPVIEPFASTTLTEPTTPTDTAIKVENSQRMAGVIILSNDTGTRRINRILSQGVTSTVLNLAFPVAARFAAGDKVIHPLVGAYDPRLEHVTYDDATDNDRLLKSSTITYSLKIHRFRDKRSVR